MADDSGKVAKLVQLKLEDYFNKQRVETEFDPGGKGMNIMLPQAEQLEVNYLRATEEQWKRKRKETKKQTRNTGKQTNNEEASNSQETQSGVQESEEAVTDVSPRVTRNTKVKSRVRGSEIERITKNAQSALGKVSVNKIHNVHRYRPRLTPKEYINLGKVAHVSHHVNAILNTEHAWTCAEEYDDREAARKYVEEKNERREKGHEDVIKASDDSHQPPGTKKIPIWLRVELEKNHRATQAKVTSAKRKQGRNQEAKVQDSSLGDVHHEEDAKLDTTREEQCLGGGKEEMMRNTITADAAKSENVGNGIKDDGSADAGGMKKKDEEEERRTRQGKIDPCKEDTTQHPPRNNGEPGDVMHGDNDEQCLAASRASDRSCRIHGVKDDAKSDKQNDVKDVSGKQNESENRGCRRKQCQDVESQRSTGSELKVQGSAGSKGGTVMTVVDGKRSDEGNTGDGGRDERQSKRSDNEKIGVGRVRKHQVEEGVEAVPGNTESSEKELYHEMRHGDQLRDGNLQSDRDEIQTEEYVKAEGMVSLSSFGESLDK